MSPIGLKVLSRRKVLGMEILIFSTLLGILMSQVFQGLLRGEMHRKIHLTGLRSHSE